MKKLIFLLFISLQLFAQNELNLNFDYAQFRYDSTSNYFEIYYSFDQEDLTHTVEDGVSVVKALMHIQIQNIETDELVVNKDWKLVQPVNGENNPEKSKALLGALGFILKNGDYTVSISVADEINAAIYDQRKASKINNLSIELASDIDLANINRRANFAKIYLVKEDNQVVRYVLPIHGYGLWSTLYGYVTLEEDLNTIYALKFYDHKETPGLGGEVDNLKWQASWKGKQLFDQDNQLALNVVKGAVVPGNVNENYQVDGLSGATLTSNGVTNMFQFWMGEYGFEEFMNKVRAGEVL